MYCPGCLTVIFCILMFSAPANFPLGLVGVAAPVAAVAGFSGDESESESDDDVGSVVDSDAEDDSDIGISIAKGVFGDTLLELSDLFVRCFTSLSLGTTGFFAAVVAAFGAGAGAGAVTSVASWDDVLSLLILLISAEEEEDVAEEDEDEDEDAEYEEERGGGFLNGPDTEVFLVMVLTSFFLGVVSPSLSITVEEEVEDAEDVEPRDFEFDDEPDSDIS